MARSKKKSKAKKKSHTPSVRHLRYRLTNSSSAGTETSHFISLARDLSAVNRRLYRQGKHYFVKKITVTSRNTTNGLVSVGAAPTSWITGGAWRRAFKLWNQMREGHGGAPGSGLPTSVTPATWADFKVYLSNDHRTATMAVPLDNGNNAVSLADSEWVYSKYQSPDGTTGADEFTAHLLGADVGSAGSYTSVGIIQGYEESRRTVQQDETGDTMITDSWMINLFDDGTTLDEIVEDMKLDGDLPPYDINSYPGGDNNMPKPIVQQMKALVPNFGQPIAPASAVEGTSSITLGGIHAPLGILEIETQSGVADDVFDVLIEVSEGDYKGVKALDM